VNICYEVFSGDIPCETGILNLSSHDWLLKKTSSMMMMVVVMMMMTTMIPKKKLNFLFVILIVEECILLRLYTIKYDNQVTLLATIYLRANTTHVLFSQHVSAAMRHHQVKPNTIHQIISRY
jgi:hypothetical protein